MPEAPLPPPAPIPPFATPGHLPPRPPPPGALVWLAFLFGPSVVLALGCILLVVINSGTAPKADEVVGAAIGGAVAGLLVGVCFVGGLAMATRFYTGIVGRMLGGVLLGVALLVGLGAMAFAGCMCVLYTGQHL